MTVRSAFNPHRGANKIVTSAASSASVSIDAAAKSVRLSNSGASICYVRIGTGAQTASTADTPVRAGSDLVVAKAEGENTLAYISAVGTTLNIQTGEGGV